MPTTYIVAKTGRGTASATTSGIIAGNLNSKTDTTTAQQNQNKPASLIHQLREKMQSYEIQRKYDARKVDEQKQITKEVEEELSQKKDLADYLNTEVTRLEEKLINNASDYKKLLNDKDEEIQKLQQDFKEVLKKVCDNFEKEAEKEVAKMKNEYDSVIDRAMKDRERLQKETEEATVKNKKLEKITEKLWVEYQRLEKEYGDEINVLEEHGKLQQKSDTELYQKIKQLGQKNSDLENQLNSAVVARKKLESAKESKQDYEKDFEKKIEVLKNQLKDKDSASEETEKEKRKLKREIENLKTENKDLSLDLDKLSKAKKKLEVEVEEKEEQVKRATALAAGAGKTKSDETKPVSVSEGEKQKILQEFCEQATLEEILQKIAAAHGKDEKTAKLEAEKLMEKLSSLMSNEARTSVISQDPDRQSLRLSDFLGSVLDSDIGNNSAVFIQNDPDSRAVPTEYLGRSSSVIEDQKAAAAAAAAAAEEKKTSTNVKKMGGQQAEGDEKFTFHAGMELEEVQQAGAAKQATSASRKKATIAADQQGSPTGSDDTETRKDSKPKIPALEQQHSSVMNADDDVLSAGVGGVSSDENEKANMKDATGVEEHEHHELDEHGGYYDDTGFYHDAHGGRYDVQGNYYDASNQFYSVEWLHEHHYKNYEDYYQHEEQHEVDENGNPIVSHKEDHDSEQDNKPGSDHLPEEHSDFPLNHDSADDDVPDLLHDKDSDEHIVHSDNELGHDQDPDHFIEHSGAEEEKHDSSIIPKEEEAGTPEQDEMHHETDQDGVIGGKTSSSNNEDDAESQLVDYVYRCSLGQQQLRKSKIEEILEQIKTETGLQKPDKESAKIAVDVWKRKRFQKTAMEWADSLPSKHGEIQIAIDFMRETQNEVFKEHGEKALRFQYYAEPPSGFSSGADNVLALDGAMLHPFQEEDHVLQKGEDEDHVHEDYFGSLSEFGLSPEHPKTTGATAGTSVVQQKKMKNDTTPRLQKSPQTPMQKADNSASVSESVEAASSSSSSSASSFKDTINRDSQNNFPGRIKLDSILAPVKRKLLEKKSKTSSSANKNSRANNATKTGKQIDAQIMKWAMESTPDESKTFSDNEIVTREDRFGLDKQDSSRNGSVVWGIGKDDDLSQSFDFNKQEDEQNYDHNDNQISGTGTNSFVDYQTKLLGSRDVLAQTQLEKNSNFDEIEIDYSAWGNKEQIASERSSKNVEEAEEKGEKSEYSKIQHPALKKFLLENKQNLDAPWWKKGSKSDESEQSSNFGSGRPQGAVGSTSTGGAAALVKPKLKLTLPSSAAGAHPRGMRAPAGTTGTIKDNRNNNYSRSQNQPRGSGAEQQGDKSFLNSILSGPFDWFSGSENHSHRSNGDGPGKGKSNSQKPAIPKLKSFPVDGKLRKM